MFSSPKWRCLLSWIVGCRKAVFSPALPASFICASDNNTIGNIAAVASVDWGLALQIMAAASIGSGLKFTATVAQTLWVVVHHLILHNRHKLILQCRLRRLAVMPCNFMQLKLGYRGSLAGSVHCRKSNACLLIPTYSSAPAHGFLPYLVYVLSLSLGYQLRLPVNSGTLRRMPWVISRTVRRCFFFFKLFLDLTKFHAVSGWTNGYAFILSFLAPLWAIGIVR